MSVWSGTELNVVNSQIYFSYNYYAEGGSSFVCLFVIEEL